MKGHTPLYSSLALPVIVKRLESVVKNFPIAVSRAQSRARDKSAKLLPTTWDANFSAGAHDSGMLR